MRTWKSRNEPIVAVNGERIGIQPRSASSSAGPSSLVSILGGMEPLISHLCTLAQEIEAEMQDYGDSGDSPSSAVGFAVKDRGSSCSALVAAGQGLLLPR